MFERLKQRAIFATAKLFGFACIIKTENGQVSLVEVTNGNISARVKVLTLKAECPTCGKGRE